MNSKIIELAEQAGYIDKGSNHTAYMNFDFEKFAELIVEECIETITAYDLVPGHSAKWEDIYEIHARLLQDLGEEIKEHFGVDDE